MAVKADKKVFEVIHVLRDLAVKGYEHLTQKEEHIDANRISRDFGQWLNLLPAGIKAAHAPDDQAT